MTATAGDRLKEIRVSEHLIFLSGRHCENYRDLIESSNLIRARDFCEAAKTGKRKECVRNCREGDLLWINDLYQRQMADSAGFCDIFSHFFLAQNDDITRTISLEF